HCATDDLQRMHGGRDAGAIVDAAHGAAEGVLQIGVAAALAEAGAAAGNGDGTGDDEIDVRQLTRIDGAACFGGSSDRCRSTEIAEVTRVQLPEAPLLPESRDGHVHDLAFTQRAEPDVALRSVGVALDGPRAAPLVEVRKQIGRGGRTDEVRDASA